MLWNFSPLLFVIAFTFCLFVIAFTFCLFVIALHLHGSKQTAAPEYQTLNYITCLKLTNMFLT